MSLFRPTTATRPRLGGRKNWLALLLISASLVSTGGAQQAERSFWTTAADDFSQQILQRAGNPSAVTVSFDNVSSLGESDQDNLRNLILNAFHVAGVRLVKPELALAEVQITFSEDWQSYLWVANIRQGPGTQLLLKRLPRVLRSALPAAPALTVHRSVVWQQDDPILDFLQDGHNLAVLEPEQLSVYGSDNGQWKLKQVLAITHDQNWPRDLRGRLQLSGTQITAFLPGTRCSGTLLAGSLQCASTDDPWPMDGNGFSAFYSSARNFFTGVLAGQNAGSSVPAFFSGAALQNGDSHLWIFTGADGRTRIYSGTVTSPAAVFNSMAGDVAAVHSGCGSAWQLLASSSADYRQPDSVQALEVTEREALPASASLTLSGAIRALWTAADGQSANAVVQSLATGKYEAITLTVSCAQ